MENPEKALFFYNKGTLAKKDKKYKKAIKLLTKAIEYYPNFGQAYNNLALCYKETGNLETAIKTFEKAVTVEPQNYMLHANLANIYRDTGNLEKAIASYTNSLELNKIAETACDLGFTYVMLKDFEEAKRCFEDATKIDPKSPKAFYGLGHSENYLGNILSAKKAFETCYKIDKNYEQAAAALFVAKRKLCEWDGIEEIDEVLKISGNETPWGSIIRTEDPKQNLIAGVLRSLRYDTLTRGKKFKHLPGKFHNNKIKIGYVSGNFGNHPVSYTMASVFEFHDKDKFEVYAYSYGTNDGSDIRKKIINNTDKFTDIGNLNNKEAADKIHSDKIDILVDLTGYTEGTRSEIFAYKPSPIQITWAGLSASTGAPFFDYMIADKIIIPKKSRKFYTEKLAMVPPCFCPCKYIPSPKSQRPKRSDFSLPENAIVLASFNQMYKIEPVTWQYWIQILKEVPGSVLWILEQSKEGAKNLLKHAKESGIDSKRIIFAKQMSFGLFYSRMALADIALDTRIYGGGTTSYFALAQGVPIVTLKGKHPASLFTTSILEAAGLTQLVAKNMNEYLNIVKALATDKEKLKEIKLKLNHEILECSIFNVKEKTKHLESVFIKIYKNYINGSPPKDLES